VTDGDLAIGERLAAHLRSWLGAWPPEDGDLHVVGAERRVAPGWDGRTYPAIGVVRADGRGVLSVPPDVAEAVARRAATDGRAAALAALPELLETPAASTYEGIVFRWSEAPAPGPDAGIWRSADDPAVPEWLRPFGGEVLVAEEDDGTHLAGVGIKVHDDVGRELAVVTAEAARGRGLARALVAQAARRVLDDGGVPTYLHHPTNIGSAHVADASGFPDLGWTAIGISREPAARP
jgi:GNAT superfamily N-acetyltransferase